MSAPTDLVYGRRGGGWVPDGRTAATAKRCEECGQPMTCGQQRRHHVCNPDTVVGLVCTCAPGCTDIRVGDLGGCDPACDVCSRHAGRRRVALFGDDGHVIDRATA